jgi:YebC/PmpR family DNA-binding regulatory protein
MSGHSKWNNIKNRKAAVDGKKAKIFTQLAKNIRMAVKEGGSGDPKFNASLRLLLEKAREANMPKDKVQKAIDVGLGKGDGANSQEVIYEGFGPGGVGMMIVAMTNNHNRTSGEIRTILSKAGGSLGAPGCVKYMFSRSENNEFVLTMPMLITDLSTQEALQELIDSLLEHDDVEDVYCVGEWEGKE